MNRRTLIIGWAILALTIGGIAKAQVSYWASGFNRQGDAQLAQRWFFTNGSGITITYDGLHAVISASGGGGGTNSVFATNALYSLWATNWTGSNALYQLLARGAAFPLALTNFDTRSWTNGGPAVLVPNLYVSQVLQSNGYWSLLKPAGGGATYPYTFSGSLLTPPGGGQVQIGFGGLYGEELDFNNAGTNSMRIGYDTGVGRGGIWCGTYEGLFIFADGKVGIGTGINTPANNALLVDQPNSRVAFTAGITAYGNGGGISNAMGAAFYKGIATLVNGIVTVSCPIVTSSSAIVLTHVNGDGHGAFVEATNIVASTSFQILSSYSSDVNKVAWAVLNP